MHPSHFATTVLQLLSGREGRFVTAQASTTQYILGLYMFIFEVHQPSGEGKESCIWSIQEKGDRLFVTAQS